MSSKSIQGTPKLAEEIRRRRQELELTIEEAASRAGVGTKTWCRYEAGESIRSDKAKGICKALNWSLLPTDEQNDDPAFNLAEYKKHEAWSETLCEVLGEAAAIAFVIGSDLVSDYIKEDLERLSEKPKGTHIGELSISMMKDLLPEQFLMRYDYEFLYCLKAAVEKLRKTAHYGGTILAHSVIEEILIYLFMEEALFPLECILSEMTNCSINGLDEMDQWAFELFDDMDVVTCLYSDYYLTQEHCYHFDHWTKEQFYGV